MSSTVANAITGDALRNGRSRGRGYPGPKSPPRLNLRAQRRRDLDLVGILACREDFQSRGTGTGARSRSPLAAAVPSFVLLPPHDGSSALPRRGCRPPDCSCRLPGCRSALQDRFCRFGSPGPCFRTSSAGLSSPGPCFRTSLARSRAVERRFRTCEAREESTATRSTASSGAARGAEAGIVGPEPAPSGSDKTVAHHPIVRRDRAKSCGAAKGTAHYPCVGTRKDGSDLRGLRGRRDLGLHGQMGEKIWLPNNAGCRCPWNKMKRRTQSLQPLQSRSLSPAKTGPIPALST